MPSLTPDQAASLASALVCLRGETLVSLGGATGIKSANLSVWLRGKPQVIAERRVLAVLHHLGVRGTELRTDLIHHWHSAGSLSELKQVLALLLSAEQQAALRIYKDEELGLERTQFLRVGEVLIRVTLEPGLCASNELTPVTLGYGQLICVPYALATLPTESVLQLQSILFEQDDAAAFHAVHLAELSRHALESVVGKMAASQPNAAQYRYSQPPGFDELEAELKRVLKSGVLPIEIALMLSKCYP